MHRCGGDLALTLGLVLMGRRQLRSNNSWMHNNKRLMKGPPRCTLLMHPVDASERGLTDGERVEVRSTTGAVHLLLAVDEGIMPDVVSLPHGWGHKAKGAKMHIANATDGTSANDVTIASGVDALTGTSILNGVPRRGQWAGTSRRVSQSHTGATGL